ncbi:MAG TPA: response regulator transcription factor [Actinomycetota bacterium]|jgi:DNA-binding response OmpR family regulator|nr:response regulator transcription factor [Actinomycetota bacterium]
MRKARVLVADDEAPLRRLVRLYLEKEGFAVLEASTGGEALSAIRGDEVDIGIIDVMLPEMDGFEVVRRIRRKSTIPIILLTARGEETSRVAGLEVGADDYVVKPFSPPEVVARVRAQLRRAQGFLESPSVLRTDGITLDPTARECVVDGREVTLTRREFDLLASFLEHPGRVFSRDQLLQMVWGSQYVSSKTVDVHVAALRRKLGDALSVTAFRGVGYRFDG